MYPGLTGGRGEFRITQEPTLCRPHLTQEGDECSPHPRSRCLSLGPPLLAGTQEGITLLLLPSCQVMGVRAGASRILLVRGMASEEQELPSFLGRDAPAQVSDVGNQVTLH